MLAYVILFFALPVLGVVALVRILGERSTDPTLHPTPTASNGSRLHPH